MQLLCKSCCEYITCLAAQRSDVHFIFMKQMLLFFFFWISLFPFQSKDWPVRVKSPEITTFSDENFSCKPHRTFVFKNDLVGFRKKKEKSNFVYNLFHEKVLLKNCRNICIQQIELMCWVRQWSWKPEPKPNSLEKKAPKIESVESASRLISLGDFFFMAIARCK